MPSPVLPAGGQPLDASSGARRRKRKRDDPQTSAPATDHDHDDEDEDHHHHHHHHLLSNMSPEEEAGASPPRAALAAPRHGNDNDDRSLSSDVERFDGKIVYNPDGSAYIIEESELSDEETSLGALPRLLGDGCIVDGRGVANESTRDFPPIASAVYVSRHQLYGALCALGAPPRAPDPPAVHTYRVFSFRDKTRPAPNRDRYNARDCLTVPVKPILMCFVCKLSFGYAKSFIAHAQTDHGLSLLDSEKDVLGRKNSSAIIQCVGKDKEPLVSFLEPAGPAGAITTPSLPPGPADVTEVPNSLMNKQTDSNASDSNNDSLLDNGSCERRGDGESESTIGDRGSGGWGDPPHSLITVQNPQAINASVQGRSPNSPATPLPPGLSAMSMPTPPAFLSGTTIGVCPDHLQGRPSAADCPKCELILASSRMGGPLAGMHSRNSCKTLKCPKCNWHYKYQETLEIHMKEKHPEAETSCIYCIAGQPHPRLARGETYTCGYKPYRCEVCNYSTTTKGNLSIHMQSDKHLNNMQELQNGGGGGVSTGEPLVPQPPPHTPPGPHKPPPAPHHSPVTSHKPKPTFRCDVCNYETNVARNLRIHMTSEKHTHNMLVLQQNVKHMQTLSALQHQHQHSQQQLEGLLHFHPGLMPGDKPLPNAEAALADMAYNQALMIQLMTGGPLPGHGPPDLAPHLDLGLNPETMEPPPEPADPDPDRTYTCCVCNCFCTDSLEALAQHLAQDRTKVREQEILALVAGNYVCKLCTYKTNLKANFQLHCKTDKHLQRLQHVNHVKEGGPRNEWKLKYASAAGGVQVRCNACDYYTNSAHKLQLHAAGARHEAGALLLRLLRTAPAGTRARCALCGFVARARLQLLQHARSLNHLQMEQIHQLQRRSEGKDMPADISEVFQLMPQPDQSFGEPDSDTKEPIDQKPELNHEQQMLKFIEQQQHLHQQIQQQQHQQQQQQHAQQQQQLQQQQQSQEENNSDQHACPFCNFSCDSELRLQAHVVAQHGAPTPTPPAFLCPLCQDGFRDRPALERHVMQIHSVNSEGLQRLLMLVDQSHWLNSTRLVSPDSVASSKDSAQKNDSANLEEDREITSPHSEENTEYENERCTTCLKNFRNIDELCIHQNETGHLELKQTPQGPGYLCWKKGCNQYFNNAQALQMHFKEIHAKNSISNMSVSEKHVYKYRCNQCSLAFKTMEKLQLHSQYHMIRDATKCVLCGRSFRSILALHKHVETSHSELTDEEVAAFKQSLMSNPLLLAGLQGQVLDSSTNELLKKESLKLTEEEMMELEENKDMNNISNDDGNQVDGEGSDDSIVYKDQLFLEDYLNSQAMAEDSYNDPNRKYKCHRCKVAFTRQSYLTSHNKTLLHRKGEKLTYPMEKYLDPNRPFKCDVCKESFTQKNILLVHYNSVSHLHKLKRAMQEQQNNNNVTPSSPGVGGLNTSNLALTPKSTSSEEDDKKRYKCNICKVAYTQGSTLDIHMRSVLHQTRASKLQDLAISGQIDLSKPLIEQPDTPKQQDPAKIFQEMLSPKNTSPSSSSSGGARGGSPGGASSPPSAACACDKCHALFATQEQLAAHRALYCLFGAGSAALANFANFESADDMVAKANLPKRTSSQIYKTLLESFGFDLVMQYNENHQRRQLKIHQHEEKEHVRIPTPPAPPVEIPEPETIKEEEPPEMELPEIAKSTCQHCNKEFSSVWVLKTHCEEVHKDKVPLEFLEQFAEQFKNEYEKKSVVVTAATSSTVSSSPRVTSPNTESAPVAAIAASEPDQSEDRNDDRPSSRNTPALQLAQHMNEMQAALGVMQLQQQLGQLHPVVAQMISMGLPLGLNMGALAAMNLQPPLVPLMMPPPPFDQMPMAQNFAQQEGQQAALLKQHQQIMQHQQVANAAAANQKRARTRITDDQLKILRAHFDINNSPSEDAIHEMAGQSGLPPKVIKHWFRNTLFKERQRNKDSPYNFNNPPSTTLNLEEYEKTGETKVTPLNSSASSDEGKPPIEKKAKLSPAPTPPSSFHQPENLVKVEPNDDVHNEEINKYNSYDNKHQEDNKMYNFPIGLPPQSPVSSLAGSEHLPQNMSRPTTPNHMSLSSIIQSQLESIPTSTIPQVQQVGGSNHPSMLPPQKLAPQNFASPNNLPPNVLPMTPNRSLSPGRGLNEFGLSGGNSNGSNSSGGSSGKRANRTRFTDYQIKVLQEFFENNAYPKDDDLEYLSKLLGLSPRVIVVWFQNARQKARKVYENQPAVEQPLPGIPDEAGANRFQRTPGLNYQCKKCQLVFQRYYELIRHQKTHCFKEEDAKRSAQAQAAAAQVAATLSSEDSNSSTTTVEPHHLVQQMQHRDNAPQHLSVPASPVMNIPQQPITPTPSSSNYQISPVSTPTPSEKGQNDRDQKEGTFQCDKCNLVFPRFELWREHQLVHIMNPNLFPSYPPDSPFGILQQHAQLQQLNASLGGSDQIGVPHPFMSMLNNQVNKRKFDEFEVEIDSGDQPKDKRLRTTILPEQLDYLYQKYQVESNPSRKMLENIAREVGLKKRVVQVWFQNTRARERKGQFRAHAQVINKRCPFCPALFKVKSALESHLTTKHADQCSRGEINIDALPDEELSMESSPSFGSQQGDKPSNFSQGGANMMPPLFPPFHPDMEKFIKQYNEESMKRYITELQAHAAAQQNGGETKENNSNSNRPEGEIPLDLSKPVDLSRPMKVNMDHERNACEPGPPTDLSERSLCDERSDSMSETTEFYDDESNPTSPSSTQSNQRHNSSAANKRFRTQMSSLQVKIMKSLFSDYKTPTMAECEMLGREISLPKRVVQVWFQNARAKEKKHKLALQKSNGTEAEPRGPDDCKYCQFKYSHKYSVQDHVFTKGHIAAVRAALEVAGAGSGGGGGGNGSSGTQRESSDAGALALLMAARLEGRDEELLRRLCASSAPGGASSRPLLPTYPPNVNSNTPPGAGLVVETGSGAALLDLPGTSLDQIRHISVDPGLSTLRLPRAATAAPPLSRDVDLEVCFVCKHCKVAFLTDHALLAHQRQICYAGRENEKGVIRVVQTGLECRTCPNAEKFKTLQEFRKHTESEIHQRNHIPVPPKVGLPPPESPLSHEMEDVVNQITLLAARAAQESPSSGAKDSNANIQREFCAPSPAKPRFPPPGELPQQASAGH